LGATTHVATTPAQLVRVPATYGLHYLLAVPAIAADLPSLIPTTAVLPSIPVPNVSGPAGTLYTFTFVDLWSEEDSTVAEIRVTVDGQTTPVTGASPIGYQLPQAPGYLRIPCNPADIQLICSGAGPVNAGLYLGIGGSI
jgi:hypothetical protein